MAKNEGQKLKLLYIYEMLKRETDEEHGITVSDIIQRLKAHDISAERKSIYSDLLALENFGLDIIRTKDKKTRYSLASREFELPELKLLVDAVQSSRFLSLKKSRELISKLENLTSRHNAVLLHRQVYVTNRVKSMNESVYYNIDSLHSAIASDKQIEFKYFNWGVNKQKQLKYGGKTYKVSPYALIWDNEMYYVVAFDEASKSVRHYRVDKMQSINITQNKRILTQQFENTDIGVYAQATFGMFGGKAQNITLLFKNYFAGAVIDRFGKDISIIPNSDDTFSVHVKAVISPQFYGFLAGFGADVSIVAPKEVRSGYKEYCENILKNYD